MIKKLVTPRTAQFIFICTVTLMPALWFYPKLDENPISIVSIVLFVLMVYMFFVNTNSSRMLYRAMIPGTAVVDKGVVEKVYDSVSYLFWWDKTIRGKKIIRPSYSIGATIIKRDYRIEEIIDMNVSPMLSYRIKVAVVNEREAFQGYYDNIYTTETSLENYLKQLLFRFNKRHSVFLKNLSNPFDEEEQSLFFYKISLFIINPSLAKAGLSIETGMFDIGLE